VHARAIRELRLTALSTGESSALSAERSADDALPSEPVTLGSDDGAFALCW
jgi:hypothetical protein